MPFTDLLIQVIAKDSRGRLIQQACEATKSKLIEVAKHLKETKCNSNVNYARAAREELSRASGKKGQVFINKLRRVESSGLKVFESLVEWRDLLAKVIDEKPEQILSRWTLVDLASSQDSSLANIQKTLSPCDKRINNPDSSEPLQAGVVQKLLQSGGTYIQEIRSIECHNCLKVGHGPAWACPFPKIKENYRNYYLRPENEVFRHYQYQRRFNKINAKVGEVKALEIINNTRKTKCETENAEE